MEEISIIWPKGIDHSKAIYSLLGLPEEVCRVVDALGKLVRLHVLRPFKIQTDERDIGPRLIFHSWTRAVGIDASIALAWMKADCKVRSFSSRFPPVGCSRKRRQVHAAAFGRLIQYLFCGAARSMIRSLRRESGPSKLKGESVIFGESAGTFSILQSSDHAE